VIHEHTRCDKNHSNYHVRGYHGAQPSGADDRRQEKGRRSRLDLGDGVRVLEQPSDNQAAACEVHDQEPREGEVQAKIARQAM